MELATSMRPRKPTVVLTRTRPASEAAWAGLPWSRLFTPIMRSAMFEKKLAMPVWIGCGSTVSSRAARTYTCAVAVTIDAKSIDTNNETRDNHLRSNDFFATDSFPTLSFKSSKVEVKGESIKVYGDLTIRGISKPVVLEGAYNGVTKDNIDKFTAEWAG